MAKYRVKVQIVYTSEVTVEAPNESLLKKSIKNDVKLNGDEWDFEEKVIIESKVDEELETPQFKLDNGLLVDYDTPSEEDLDG